MNGPPATPRRFALLPLIAVVAWLPVAPDWASDDFLALHYARDFGNVLHDFVGPQDGATDVWWFYRPLITLSFWFDLAVGGPWPPFAHWHNVVAHAASTLLVALIWRRFVGDGTAFAAALLWTVMPSHTGSIAWAVGRVDSHTTVWCLLAVWLALRAHERRGRALPMVLAGAAALASKELAFVVPPLATWLCCGLPSASGVATRLREALRTTWPLWALLLVYLPFRLVVLGRFGGYDAGSYEWRPMLHGLGAVVADLAVPLGWIGAPATGGPASAGSVTSGPVTDSLVPVALWLTAAALPVAIAALLGGCRRPRLALGAAVAFLVAIVPMAGFLRATDNPHNLRYYYLPAIALTGVLAAAGRLAVVAVLLAWLWPLAAVRVEQHAADGESARMHRALLRAADEAPTGPMFVAGLPHGNRAGTAVQLHFGVDRMLRPPFCTADRALYALRPLAALPGVVRLDVPDEPPFALPAGSTWWFPDATSFGRAAAPPPLPELVLAGDDDGVLDLTSPRLDGLIEVAQAAFASGAATFGLTTPGVRPQAFRVTILTANGYLGCLCQDHAAAGDAAGRIDVLRFFALDPARPLAIGRLSTRVDSFVGDALVVPTTIDLLPEFPTLVEAGDFDLATRHFTPTHRARRLVTLRFDRDYPDWVRRAQNKP